MRGESGIAAVAVAGQSISAYMSDKQPIAIAFLPLEINAKIME